jgi:hypothetical protein
VEKDGPLYSSYLQSPLGGAWTASEIGMLKNPSPAQVQAAVRALGLADYSMVVFSGHGYYSANKGSTIIELTPGVEIDSLDLSQGTTKRTVILDCCRVVIKELVLEQMMRKSLAKADSIPNVEAARFYYDKQISDCPSGLVKLFACSINETAGDDSQLGGVYSHSLVSGAEEWAKEGGKNTSTSYYILDVSDAHDRAAVRVVRLSGGTQNPTIQKPRSGPYFPFAVVA